MFELKIAWKYLIPQKKALSTSLISLLSIFVISLVVWLVVVFLSVTTGIEENWFTKLTSLNAPIRITPTKQYFSSYYYQIDQISSSSNFSYKTIGEKASAVSTDPYQPEIDEQIPESWPANQLYEDGSKVDLVKDLYSVLETFSGNVPGFRFQDYEVSGAFMRLDLVRPIMENSHIFEEASSSISQMSYLLTFAENNPQLPSILKSPSVDDLNHLLENSPRMERSWIEHLNAQQVCLQNPNVFPRSFLDTSKVYKAYLVEDVIVLPLKQQHIAGKAGALTFKGSWVFESKGKTTSFRQIVLSSPLLFTVKSATSKDIDVVYDIQGIAHFQKAPWEYFTLYQTEAITTFTTPPASPPPWVYTVTSENKTHVPSHEFSSGVLIPVSYQKNGVLLGDRGYLSFQAPAGGSTQEHRISIHVAGFYDPGMLPIGNKSLLVPPHITRTLNGLTQIFSPDGSPNNGVFVWHKNLNSAPQVQKQLQAALEKTGLSPFWEVKTFRDYEFSKDLMQQFQSDRLLFTLIAAIILIVACSNIISMLVLLVNDKKKEIATLRAMGASSKEIALIFGICGATIGIVSSLIGIFAAVFTLQHLDILVSFLSAIQGHDAFHVAFFGDTLPNQLSWNALWFVAIVTPLISILAGLVPAVKATKLQASNILRSE